MKRIIATLLILGSLLTLTACSGGNSNNNGGNGQINLEQPENPFDYMKEDLTRYVEVPKSVYESYEVTLSKKEDEEKESAPRKVGEKQYNKQEDEKKDTEQIVEEDDETDEIMDQFIAQAMEKVTFKQIPEKALTKEYDNIVSELNSDFKSSDYKSLDEYAAAHYGLSEGDKWQDAAMADAEYEVKSRLIIFSIARAESLEPTEEEKNLIMKRLKIASYNGTISSNGTVSTGDFVFSQDSFEVGDNVTVGTNGGVIVGANMNSNGAPVHISVKVVYVDELVLEQFAIDYITSLATVVYV